MKKLNSLPKLCILFLLLSPVCLQAQVSSVNHATGTLSASIPIYTLNEGNLSVPISLSYDGSGVLVEATATNVGLNWSLNAGGYISREVRSLPDESSYIPISQGYGSGGYPADNEWGLFKDYEPDIFTIVLNGSTIRFIIKPNTNLTEVLLLNDNTDVKIEIVNTGTVCDAFCVSIERALCNSSRFLGEFIVTMPDGIRYLFGSDATHREYILSRNSLPEYLSGGLPINFGETISSRFTRPVKWNLSSIENPKGSKDGDGKYISTPYQKITFTYARAIQKLESGGYNKEIAPIVTHCDDLPLKTNEVNDVIFLYKSDLARIESDNVLIYFNHPDVVEMNINPGVIPTNISEVIPDFPVPYYIPDDPFRNLKRKDLPDHGLTSDLLKCDGSGPVAPNTAALNNIIVQDKTARTYGVRGSEGVTGYFLYHKYFKEYTFNAQNGQKTEVNNKRLSLAGVYPIKFNPDNLTSELMPGYVLEYNPGTLPDKNSFAHDHWGYHNGANTNEYEGIAYNTGNTTLSCRSAEAGANLGPNFDAAKIGSLKSVHLPTGGKESYDYELHDCINYAYAPGQNKVGGLRIKSIQLSEPASSTVRTTSLDYRTKASGVSSGVLAVIPTYLTSFGSQTYVHVNAYGILFSRLTSRTYLTYSEVKETTEGTDGINTSTQGYTEYEFYNLESTRSASQRAEQKIPTNLSWWYSDQVLKEEFIRGFPKAVRQYNSEGVLISEKQFKYDVTNLTETNGYDLTGGLHVASVFKLDNTLLINMIGQLSVGAQSIATVNLFFPNPAFQTLGFYVNMAATVLAFLNSILGIPQIKDNSTYRITTYKVPFVRTRLSTNTGIAYDANGQNPIETTSKYEYLSNNHKQATNIKNYRSHDSGNSLDELLDEKNIIYSKDYKDCSQTNSSTSALTGLYFREMNVPVEIITKRGTRVTGGSFLEYFDKTSSKEGLLKMVSSLELTQPLATFTTGSCTVGKSSSYKPVVSINDYNERGLAKEIVKVNEGGVTTIGYGVNNYLPTSTTYTSGSKQFSTSRDYAIPIWGMSKITDINNNETTITYDRIGRPVVVRDKDNNVIKSYKYKEAAPN